MIKFNQCTALHRKCLSISVGPRQSINSLCLNACPASCLPNDNVLFDFPLFWFPNTNVPNNSIHISDSFIQIIGFSLPFFCCLSFHRNGERNFSRREEGVENDKFSLTFAREWTANFYIGIMLNSNISSGKSMYCTNFLPYWHTMEYPLNPTTGPLPCQCLSQCRSRPVVTVTNGTPIDNSITIFNTFLFTYYSDVMFVCFVNDFFWKFFFTTQRGVYNFTFTPKSLPPGPESLCLGSLSFWDLRLRSFSLWGLSLDSVSLWASAQRYFPLWVVGYIG